MKSIIIALGIIAGTLTLSLTGYGVLSTKADKSEVRDIKVDIRTINTNIQAILLRLGGRCMEDE